MTETREFKMEKPQTSKVWSLGMSKTGTASMQEALGLLGFPSSHAYTLLEQPKSICESWTHALRAKYLASQYPALEPYTTRAQFDSLLASQGHTGVTDVPGICFAEELITLYPESKIVLVERPGGIEKWFDSFWDTVYVAMSTPMNQLIARLDTRWFGPMFTLHLTWLEAWMGVDTRHLNKHPREEVAKKAKKCYTEHYELVRRITPRERLLEYKLGQGWGPLCDFLGVQVPQDAKGDEIPFPHVNEKEAMKAKVDGVVRQSLLSTLRRAGIVGGVLAAAAVAWFFGGNYIKQ